MIRMDEWPRARSAEDVRLVASALRVVPPQWRKEVAAHIVENRLMLPQWWARPFFWVVSKFRAGTWRLWYMLEARTPGLSAELLERTAEWAVRGRDTVDKDSAGGFCQDELDLLVVALLAAEALSVTRLQRSS